MFQGLSCAWGVCSYDEGVNVEQMSCFFVWASMWGFQERGWRDARQSMRLFLLYTYLTLDINTHLNGSLYVGICWVWPCSYCKCFPCSSSCCSHPFRGKSRCQGTQPNYFYLYMIQNKLVKSLFLCSLHLLSWIYRLQVQHSHLTDSAAADTAAVGVIVNTLHRIFPSFDYRCSLFLFISYRVTIHLLQ